MTHTKPSQPNVYATVSEDGRYVMMTDPKTGRGCNVLISTAEYGNIVRAFLGDHAH